MMTSQLLEVARGDKRADLLLTNARMVDVYSGDVIDADIAIFQGYIAGIGGGYRARQRVDVGGAYVAPGLIDAHVHIESSLCVPAVFASAVLPHGVTCAVIDPHEIANVAGVAGIRYMIDSCRQLPMAFVVMASSCVPATKMETSGAYMAVADLTPLLEEGLVHGLAEVMNYPGVVSGEPEIHDKLERFRTQPIDGHAPGVTGPQLNAYVTAGIGSDHECATVEEAAEKLSRGMYILIREATNARNLKDLLPLVTPRNSRRFCFCTDDRIPADLVDQGSIDYMVRVAIDYGIDPVDVIRMATLNTAEWYRLPNRGAIAPGKVADLIIFEEWSNFQVRQVYTHGHLVAENGEMRPEILLSVLSSTTATNSSVNIKWDSVDLGIQARGQQAHVIGALEDQLITEDRLLAIRISDGFAVADPKRDILKMAVIERHHASGALGKGFVQGIGLRTGAIAGTIAHDHHNLIVIGADDASMHTAIRAVAGMNGGLAVAQGDDVLAQLPLPVAGLMSAQPIEVVRRGYDKVLAAAHRLGSRLHDPAMAMSFMALAVIPKLKLTDQGLVDVEAFEIIDLFET